MNEPIYLDGFATTPLAPEAQAATVKAWSLPGNAGSPHGAGERAADFVNRARAEVAALIGASPAEIIFTSGATEANNLAILGSARAAQRAGSSRDRIVVSAVEHKAVLEPVERLKSEGYHVALAPVDRTGRLDLEAFSALLGESTLLVSIMAANNETGVIQQITEATRLAHAAGAFVHCDAAQAAGKIRLDVIEMDVDYLSISAHKMYGPMGVGALYVGASALRPEPLQIGGGQQSGLRPGTEPVPLIAGFGAAARVSHQQLEEDREHGAALADGLLAELRAHQLRPIRVTGTAPVVPGSLALSLPGVDAEQLCLRLAHTVHLSTGSACTAGQLRVSHVLNAMGLSDRDARSFVRILCHRYLDSTHVGDIAAAIADAARRSSLAAGEPRQ